MSFTCRRFPVEIILICVRWYCKYGIGYRDLTEMMQERGVAVDPSTIMQWVVAFLFADLIVLPILDIYRKYYGWKVSAFLFVTFYIAMVGAALAVEFTFSALHLIPQQRSARVMQETISWNYTTWLNIGFLMLALLLVWLFLRTGGPEMLRMMSSGRHGEDPKHHGAGSVAHGEGSGPGKFDGASADPIRPRRP